MSRHAEVAWASKMPLVAAAQLGVVHVVDLDSEFNLAGKRMNPNEVRRGDETLCGRRVGRHPFMHLRESEPRCQRCAKIASTAVAA